MIIGSHVSTAGGLDKAIDRTVELGVQSIQIFVTPPQSWLITKHIDEEIKLFREKAKKNNINPVFLHGIYLLNLASNNPDLVKKSADSLIHYLKIGHEIGAIGTIFHIGSNKNIINDQIKQSLETILQKTPKDQFLILENTAGAGGTIGRTFKELIAIKKLVNPKLQSRIKFCLDTEHAWAAGWKLLDISNFKDVICLHANDSKVPFGSNKDRHENIGDGTMGLKYFQDLARDNFFGKLPWLLEVPGIDGKSGPDITNIERLKNLLN